MSPVDAALLARFLPIAEERLRRLNGGVIEIEQGRREESLVAEVMREIHTLKGESRMVGLLAVNRVAHRTEDLLLEARRAGRFDDSGLLGLVYDGLDLLGRLLAAQGPAREAADSPDAAAFSDRVDGLLGKSSPPPPAGPASAAGTTSPAAATAPAAAPAPGAAADEAEEGTARAPTGGAAYRVQGRVVDELTRTTGVIGVLLGRVRQDVEEAARLHDRLRALTPGTSAPGATALAEHEALLRSLKDTCFTLSLRQQRLQDAVATLRLSEAATLLGRFPRTVRDLARELGKEASVTVEGGHVGVDQQVLEALADPMLHLVRNAVDHGIEAPELREAAGKPRRGSLRLSAHQAGRFVEIRVDDDGRGIDPRAIGEAAVRRGLLTEADVSRMGREALLDLLFRPSFSTRTEVSDLSGRGVGLDVVRTAVQQMGGTVRIESEVGRGTRFVLRVPVSVALVDALVVEIGAGAYAFPSVYVDRVMETDVTAVETAGPVRTVRLPDGGRAAVLDLAAALGFPATALPSSGPVRLVVVEHGRRVAFLVPRLIGEMALVQEALDPFLKGLRVVTGTATLEGGRHVVILNAVRLVETLRAEGSAVEAPAAEPAARRRVLVVEDSDLTRGMLVGALADRGFETQEAVDGRDALGRMETEVPDLVLTDLDMPVMDGVRLIREMRQDARLRAVPVVVFSTRESPDDKRQAAEAGADAYFVKSSFDEEAFVAALDRLLEARAPREAGA